MNAVKLRIMRELFDHILELHGIGIIATEEKVEEERQEMNNTENFEEYMLEFADYSIASISLSTDMLVSDSKRRHESIEKAISKNRRRIAWIKANRDSSLTIDEMWKKAKKAVG